MTLIDWLLVWCVASAVLGVILAGAIGRADLNDEDGPA